MKFGVMFDFRNPPNGAGPILHCIERTSTR